MCEACEMFAILNIEVEEREDSVAVKMDHGGEEFEYTYSPGERDNNPLGVVTITQGDNTVSVPAASVQVFVDLMAVRAEQRLAEQQRRNDVIHAINNVVPFNPN